MQYQFLYPDRNKLVLPGTSGRWEDITMEIKEERLLAFMELYEKKIGVTLTRSEAHKRATLLMQYVMLFLKPLAKFDDDGINNMSNESE